MLNAFDCSGDSNFLELALFTLAKACLNFCMLLKPEEEKEEEVTTATTAVPSDVVAISALGFLAASWKSSTLELERPCNACFGISLEVGAWEPRREVQVDL